MSPLAAFFLCGGWLMLAVVIGSLFLTGKKRRKLQKRIRELERQVGQNEEILAASRFSMAERNLALLELKESLEQEKERSAKLLRNILPDRVIRELQDFGESKPENFANTTVFFSDIVGFTGKSSMLPPEVLIGELSEMFSEFDRIFSKNHCQRIKTIGDAYMSVSGLPTADPNHCGNILRAALEAMSYLEKRNQTSFYKWEMRFGVNSGPLVGGIVGREKYIYDVFGDTVNVAARMEQLSESMKINVSETTRQLAGEAFHFQPREAREVKGRGVMKMYFLEKME